jgi:lysophospholipase L1-like esterase
MKHLFFLAFFGAFALGTQAQNVTISLSQEQYNKIKDQIHQKDREEKVQSYDWAQFGRYAEANKKVTKAPRVVFMGNSITDNWASMRPDFFTKNNFLGRGISGQTSSEMLVRFRADVIELHPKMVIINAGTNDIAHNNGTIKIENTLQNIISMAELAKVNNIRPILSSVLPSVGYGWVPSIKPANTIIALNKMIKAYAKKNGFTYIDYYSLLVDENGGLPKKYSNDGTHPTKEGYVIMENLVLKTLK